MCNNCSFYKEIKSESVMDFEVYKFVNKLLFSSGLKYYLDHFSGFDWNNIFFSEEVIDEKNDKINNIFYILDIENIKDDDFFEFFKKKKYESVNESFDFIAREEIIRLNYLIYHHVDNYNESLITNRGYVNPTDLRFLKSILDRIVEKLENIEKNKIEINLSKDKTLN